MFFSSTHNNTRRIERALLSGDARTFLVETAVKGQMLALDVANHYIHWVDELTEHIQMTGYKGREDPRFTHFTQQSYQVL